MGILYYTLRGFTIGLKKLCAFLYNAKQSILPEIGEDANIIQRNAFLILVRALDGVFIRFNHLFRRVTRTTFTPCMELFQPFFRVFARKYLDF